MNNIRNYILGVMVICQVIGYGQVGMFTYHFFHANVFHLAANALSAWLMFHPARKDNARTLLLAYVIATLTYPLALRPIIGFSNILFASVGLRTPSLKSDWWRSHNTKVYLSVMVLMLLLPQFSAVTHIISFIIGIMVAIVMRYLTSLSNDIKHETYR